MGERGLLVAVLAGSGQLQRRPDFVSVPSVLVVGFAIMADRSAREGAPAVCSSAGARAFVAEVTDLRV